MAKTKKVHTKPTYSFRSSSRLAGDPDRVGRRLGALSKAHGGLTAQQVVNDAREDDSPLHSYFEWSDDVAAERYRLEQARHLIRHVVVVYAESPDALPTRAYIVFKHREESDPPADEARYLPMATVMSDETLRRRALCEALEESDAWAKRYSYLDELADVFAALDRVKVRIKKK